MRPFFSVRGEGRRPQTGKISSRKPGREWLAELKGVFPASVWLNPVPKERWGFESATIRQIGNIFHMEDLTLSGIRRAVEHLNVEGRAVDGR